jgi:AcrR family transcriptional regulator
MPTRRASTKPGSDVRAGQSMAIGSLALRSVDRSIERRRAAYEDEVRRLIDASFSIVSESGCLDPKVGEIIAEAGLSNQAFYKHFRSKHELMLAVLDEGILTLCSYLEHRMAKVRSPERRIRQWLSGMLEQSLNPASARATRPFALSRARLAEHFPEEVKRSEAQLSGLLESAIAEAAQSGELRNVDPPRDATLIYNLTMGWLERHLADETPARRADAEHLIQFVMAGLGRGSSSRNGALR